MEEEKEFIGVVGHNIVECSSGIRNNWKMTGGFLELCGGLKGVLYYTYNIC